MHVRERIGVLGPRWGAVVLPPDEPGVPRLIGLQPVAVGLDMAVPVHDLDELTDEEVGARPIQLERCTRLANEARQFEGALGVGQREE